jgi:hypothetical protein
MKVAVMTDTVAAPLVAEAERVCKEHGWELRVGTERECGRMLLNNEVSLALVSPLGYGRGVGKADFRIVPGRCVALKDYADAAGISFRSNLDEIRDVSSDDPASFFSAMALVILREKFDSTAESVTAITDDSTTIVSAGDDQHARTLDISEETVMPFALWVCRTESEIDKVLEATTQMAAFNDDQREVIEESDAADETFPRSGTVLYRWNDEVEAGLQSVLNVLFFHQFFPDLPAIKVLGRDEL